MHDYKSATTLKISGFISEKDGFVSYKVVTNSPPVNGSCVFTPNNGTARKTKFAFNCTNWRDDEPDSVLSYKAFYSFGVNEEKQSFLLYHGPKSAVEELTLPAAPDEYGNIFNLSINVEDPFKAYASVDFSVTVCLKQLFSVFISCYSFNKIMFIVMNADLLNDVECIVFKPFSNKVGKIQSMVSRPAAFERYFQLFLDHS